MVNNTVIRAESNEQQIAEPDHRNVWVQGKHKNSRWLVDGCSNSRCRSGSEDGLTAPHPQPQKNTSTDCLEEHPGVFNLTGLRSDFLRLKSRS